MGSEIQSGVMRAQKRKIQISRLIKNFIFSLKIILLGVLYETGSLFLHLFSKFNRKHLVSFMNVEHLSLMLDAGSIKCNKFVIATSSTSLLKVTPRLIHPGRTIGHHLSFIIDTRIFPSFLSKHAIAFQFVHSS
jgi:hypothetical protein